MKAWRAARTVDFCGSCGQRQAAGAPLLVLTTLVRGEVRRWLRCEACAGEPAPMVAEPPIARPEPAGAVPVASWRRFEAANLPRDWQMAAAGDSQEGDE